MEAVARIQWGGRRWFVPRGPRVPRTVTSRFGGPGLVLASSASLQTSAALATTAFAVYGPAGTGALRFAFAAPVLLLLARPRVRGRSPRFWLSASIFAITLVALNVVLYEAIARVSLGTVVSLQFLGPLALALVGVRRRLDALWIAAATAGVLSLTGGPGRGPALGVGLALVAGALTVLSLILGVAWPRRAPGSTGCRSPSPSPPGSRSRSL
jgi:inner membrane transporter RhtA